MWVVYTLLFPGPVTSSVSLDKLLSFLLLTCKMGLIEPILGFHKDLKDNACRVHSVCHIKRSRVVTITMEALSQ